MVASVLTTLGGFAFKADGKSSSGPPTRKARALMAYLAMNADAELARERLIETFWPDAQPDHARASLANALSSIRACLRSLGTDCDAYLTATKSVVRWTGETQVDARRFAELAMREDPSASSMAARLYRGDFLEGDYDEWSVAERERLTTLYEAVLARAVRAQRDPVAARLLLARNPYAEEAYAALIEAELEAGRNTAALAVCTRCREALAEVEETPSAAFEERFGHIKVRSLEVPPTNLPRQITSFVGRDVELGEINGLLAKSQLVTVIGAGGVGKTRVAIQAAVQVLHQFDDGVWFADLATIDGEGAVVTEIASALDVRPSNYRELQDAVIAHLKLKRLLLVLDNCEHVVFEAARVVREIMKACPHVVVLTTSREQLGASGEHTYRLPSMAVPRGNEALTSEVARTFGAVALFCARASASDAAFALTDDNVGAVVEICRHVDGIALALELAAARVPALNVHQLLDRLRREFRLLKGDDVGVHPRHQTMYATLDWSYDWLSETEKALFRRLGIFRGGWSLSTIYAAGVDESLGDLAVLDLLWPLVKKSLIAVELRATSQRYRLLEPMRQYALPLLEKHGEYDTAADQHARYFAEFARREGSKWLKVDDFEYVATIEEEIDNIRAALEWTLVRGNDRAVGAEIAGYLGPFWVTRYYNEGLRWMSLAQSAVTYESHPVLSVQIAHHRIRAYLMTDGVAAARIGQEALPTARAVGEGPDLTRVLLLYGSALVMVRRFDEAEAIANESLAMAERIGDVYRIWANHMALAKLNWRRGNLDAARRHVMLMSEAYRRVDLHFDRHRWMVLAVRANLERLDGHLERAIELASEGHAITWSSKDWTASVYAEYYLSALHFLSGEDGAFEHARSVLKVSREELQPHGVAGALQVLAGVGFRHGLHDEAARLLGFAEERFSTQAVSRDAFVEVDPEWFLEPLRVHFGEAKLAKLMSEGAAWSEDRAVEEALKIT